MKRPGVPPPVAKAIYSLRDELAKMLAHIDARRPMGAYEHLDGVRAAIYELSLKLMGWADHLKLEKRK